MHADQSEFKRVEKSVGPSNFSLFNSDAETYHKINSYACTHLRHGFHAWIVIFLLLTIDLKLPEIQHTKK